MFEPGQKIRNFEILRHVWTGGMAFLYLARRTGASGFERCVAIKVVQPHLADDPAFTRMFVDEALLSARIEHPNVVRVEELGEVESTHFLVMEYVHGCSLARLIDALDKCGRRLTARLAVHIAIQVLDGLHAAHETRGPDGRRLGVVHRDVSPQNILLAYGGHVKLADFGIAKARGQTHDETVEGVVRGKLRYMSPEQTRAHVLDARSDIYSLAVVLWEMLTGMRYFDTQSDLELIERVRRPVVRSPSEAGANVPAGVDEALLAALSPDRAHRPKSALELRRRLAGALPEATSVDAELLAGLLRGVMGEQIARDAELVPDSVREVITGSDSAEVPDRPQTTRTALATLTVSTSAAGSRPDGAPLPPPEPEEESSSEPIVFTGEAQSDPPRPLRSKWPWWTGGLAATAAAVTVAVVAGLSESPGHSGSESAMLRSQQDEAAAGRGASDAVPGPPPPPDAGASGGPGAQAARAPARVGSRERVPPRSDRGSPRAAAAAEPGRGAGAPPGDAGASTADVGDASGPAADGTAASARKGPGEADAAAASTGRKPSRRRNRPRQERSYRIVDGVPIVDDL